MSEKVITIGAVLIILSLSMSCGLTRWNECRRLHPWGYCASDGS